MPRMPTAAPPFQPTDLPGVLRQAMALHSQGNVDAARTLYRRILSVVPNHFDATHLLGVTYAQTGDQDKALELFSKALSIKPGHPEALFNRGTMYQQQHAHDDAIADFTCVIDEVPGHQGALNNRSVCLEGAGRLEEALADSDSLVALDPENAVFWNNRGKLLGAMMDFEAALTCLNKAVALKPDYAEAFNNRAGVLAEFHRFDEALADYHNALAIRPDFADVKLGKGQLLVQQGNYSEGWPLFECRWQQAGRQQAAAAFDTPPWLGNDDLAGKTILVHAEQGLGDTIQFCRYVPLLAERGARVIVRAQPPVIDLLSSLDGVAHLLRPGDKAPEWDFHCPMMSLPLAFGTMLDTVPDHGPYLSAEPDLVTHWADRLGSGTKPRVAIAWRGNPENSYDRRRRINLCDFVRLLDGNMEWISLHHELTDDEASLIEATPQLTRPLDENTDMTDAAAICAIVDVVISIDTSLAHIAGATGRPTIVMLPFQPDFRWPVNRAETPWYANLTLLHQRADRDWAPVVRAAVAAAAKVVESAG